jgi:hypothetical protein
MEKSATGRIQDKAWTCKPDYRKIGPFGAAEPVRGVTSGKKINRAADGN